MPGNGDEFRRRRPGEHVPDTAYYYNELSALILRDRQHQQSGTVPPASPFADPALIFVKNTSGSNVAAFGVLAIDTPTFDPSTAPTSFKDRLVMNGVAPVASNHAGKFGVMVEPVANGKIGRAVVGGAVQVQINVTSTNHTTADVANGDITQLASSGSGAARILWHASGTGTQWAVIRIGGSAGSSSAYAKLTADWSATTGHGNVVTGNPCNADGTGVDTSTTLNLYLAAPFAAKVQWNELRTGDVVAYSPATLPSNGTNTMNGICLPTQTLPAASTNHTYLSPVMSGTVVTGLAFDYVRCA